VTLSLGARRGEKFVVVLDGTPVELQDEHARFLLKLVAEHRRAPGAPVEAADLGIENRDYLTSRFAKAIAKALPKGFSLVLKNRRGGWWLNPKTNVGRVDWAGISRDSHPGIAKIAKDMKAR
jgi:hypothetical protein